MNPKQKRSILLILLILRGMLRGKDRHAQTRLISLIESITNVAVGFVLAVTTQITVFPMFGLTVSLGDNLVIGCMFTAVSLVRSFTLRRFFEALRTRNIYRSRAKA